MSVYISLQAETREQSAYARQAAHRISKKQKHEHTVTSKRFPHSLGPRTCFQ